MIARIGVLVVLVSGCATVQQGPPLDAGRFESRLRCSVDAPREIRQGEPLPVRITISSELLIPLRVLTSRTPLAGTLTGDVFAIRSLMTAAAAPIDYVGTREAPAEPVFTDYATLPPEGALTAALDLSTGYKVEPGVYRVQWRGYIPDVIPRGGGPRLIVEQQGAQLDCPPVVVVVRKGGRV